MNTFKKKKSNGGMQVNCLICGIKVRTNVDQTCGSPECKLKAHNLFHKLIQESSQDKYSRTSIGVFV